MGARNVPEERPAVAVRSVRTMLMILGALTLGYLAQPTIASAEEYRATIVDEETGQPLQGVVIVAVWNRRYNSLGGWAGGGYYASEETETGPDGKFVLKGHATWTLLPLITTIKGPEFTFYKPGYDTVWGFQGSSMWPTDVFDREARVEEEWKRFRGQGTVLTLSRLHSRQERLRAFPDMSGDVPRDKIPKLLDAVGRERAALGLSP
jgi:hypothetical protein